LGSKVDLLQILFARVLHTRTRTAVASLLVSLLIEGQWRQNVHEV